MENSPALRKYAKVAPYIYHQWRGLAVILTLTVLSAGTAALTPWPIKFLVDYAVGDTPLPESLGVLIDKISYFETSWTLVFAAAAASLILFLINSLLDVGLTWTWSWSGQHMIYELARDLFAQLQRLSLIFHSRGTVGDWLSRLTGDIWCPYTLAGAFLVAPVQHICTIVIVAILAWTLDPLLTVALLGATPILVISAAYFGNKLKDRTRQQRENQAVLTSFVQQTLTAMPIVQAFCRERANREQFAAMGKCAVTLGQQTVISRQLFRLVNGLSLAVVMAIILCLGGNRVLSGTLSLGSLLVFLAYVRTLVSSFKALLDAYGDAKIAEASVDRVLEVTQSLEAVRNSPHARPLPEFSSSRSAITFDRVGFNYEPSQVVLKDISFDIRKGESIALIGSSGAGKSTLVSMIPRFFDPVEGRILLNDLDIRDVTIESLRQNIALVLQDAFLLPLSVAENISYGRSGASRDEIIAAATAANAHEFITLLPDGYDTVIGQRGSTLSAGQKQRISIARALLKDSPIVILDEPTSALDHETENMVMGALKRLMVGRTVIIIAHRLSTIRDADRILVLEKGTIVESGTHEQLLVKPNGQYHRFHNLSFQDAASEGVK